jgi:hypothetical protein
MRNANWCYNYSCPFALRPVMSPLSVSPLPEEKCGVVLMQGQGAAESEPQTRVPFPRFIQQVKATPGLIWQVHQPKPPAKQV